MYSELCSHGPAIGKLDNFVAAGASTEFDFESKQAIHVLCHLLLNMHISMKLMNFLQSSIMIVKQIHVA